MRFDTLQELVEWEPPYLPTIVGSQEQALITHQSRTIIYGRWGSWKSMLAMDLMFKIAMGHNWLGFPTAKSRSAMLQIELPKKMMQERVLQYIRGNGVLAIPDSMWIASAPYYKMDSGPQYELDTQLTMYKPNLLIVDPMYKVLSQDVTNNTGVQRFLDYCDELIDKFNLSVVTIGHIRKPGDVEDGNYSLEHELLGASYFADWADNLISVQLISEEPIVTAKLTFEKHRHSHTLIDPRVVEIDRPTLKFSTNHTQ